MKALPDTTQSFLSDAGEVLAEVRLTAVRDYKDTDPVEIAPIVKLEQSEADKHGETSVQLKEAERYEYEIFNPTQGRDLRLHATGASRRKSLRDNKLLDAGMLETGSFCGTLVLALVEGEAADTSKPLATTLIDIRSLKLGYRDQYRGMLRRLSKELVGLVVDCRQSAKTTFRSSFRERNDVGWLQIQLELLRETLDSKEFTAALQRILSFPHEQLRDDLQKVATEKPIRWTPAVLRQLAHGQPRKQLPEQHPLRKSTGMESIASRVLIQQRIRNLDTPENRFIKHALQDVRAFLTHAASVFAREKSWQASAALAKRLATTLDDWLGRGLFRDVGPMNFSPLGSPVLQRKAGYREILHWWLRFHTAAELSWEGGEDLFKAGQRNVADLYEYWLFFEMLDWFCKTCCDGKKPPLEDLIDGLDDAHPNFKLKQGKTLGPFKGNYAKSNRELMIRFSYNRRFKFTEGRSASGSWTKNMHPDYTLTFWPADFSEKKAEELELLVHVHFDAKYRVEDLAGLFGNDGDGDESDDKGNYKRQDLLKMHAYRDAIKRSQGAYVLYPGKGQTDKQMQGFHEILPGLGAFAVAPNSEGEAEGTGELHQFLKKILTHLGNRTTVMERVNYHVSQANDVDQSESLKEDTVEYGDVTLPERDQFNEDRPALPPSEHRVLVVWSSNDVDFEVWEKENIAFVRLGNRPGSLQVKEELFGVRHLLVRRSDNVIGDMRKFTQDGFNVMSGKDLEEKYNLKKNAENIYAVFKVIDDPIFKDKEWAEDEIWQKIKAKWEASNPGKTLNNRRSADPAVLTLRELIRR